VRPINGEFYKHATKPIGLGVGTSDAIDATPFYQKREIPTIFIQGD